MVWKGFEFGPAPTSYEGKKDEDPVGYFQDKEHKVRYCRDRELICLPEGRSFQKSHYVLACLGLNGSECPPGQIMTLVTSFLVVRCLPEAAVVALLRGLLTLD